MKVRKTKRYPPTLTVSNSKTLYGNKQLADLFGGDEVFYRFYRHWVAGHSVPVLWITKDPDKCWEPLPYWNATRTTGAINMAGRGRFMRALHELGFRGRLVFRKDEETGDYYSRRGIDVRVGYASTLDEEAIAVSNWRDKKDKVLEDFR